MTKHLPTISFVLSLVIGAVLWNGIAATGLWVAGVGLLVALVLLVFGADYMVHGAVHLARRFGVSPFVIGVTVVAFGTSAPELAASVGASLKDAGDLAVGNVLGSNIANLCLILGATAMISSIPIEQGVRRIDAPLMAVITLLASIPLLEGVLPRYEQSVISRVDGVLLLAGLAAFIWFNARSGRIDPSNLEQETDGASGVGSESGSDGPSKGGTDASAAKAVGLFLVGLLGLVLGADLLVENASAIALNVGVSEAAIGLTVVAFGTSVPELVFSVRAAMKGHAEIAIGNILGSNVFNMLSVLGIAALVNPIPVPEVALSRDLWVVIGVSIAAVVMMRSRSEVSRIEGTVLLVAYAAYTLWVYL